MPQLRVLRSARGLGAFAAEQRQRQGLTQSELAERVGVSREWVSRFERGSGSPSLRAVMDVLSELGLELSAERVHDEDELDEAP